MGHSSPHSSAHVYCGQTAGWVKIPLGMGKASAQATMCVMGTKIPPKEGAQPPIFGQCLLWPNGRWINMPFGTEVGLGPSDIVTYAGSYQG